MQLRIVTDEHPEHEVTRNIQSHNIQSHNPQNRRTRVKEYLTDTEVNQLLKSAKHNRHGVRDELMILLAFRHGLRVSELTGLKLSHINIPAREMYIKRVKGSESNHHPLSEEEIRLLKRYLKIRAMNKGNGSDYLFLTERGEAIKPHAFNYLLAEISKRAGFTFAVYPHLLRHSCGFHIAKNGHNAFDISAYLGHKNLTNSMRYVHVNSTRFKELW